MTLWEDLLALGPAAMRLPEAALRRGCAVVRDADRLGPGPPVLLVHGYAGTGAVWDPLVRVLREAGFGCIDRFVYNSFSAEPVGLVEALAAAAARARAETGAPGVHLVGHSLGGLLVRAVALRRRPGSRVLTAVTIATPHGGSPFASLALGPCAALMRTRSSLRTVPRSPDRATRWTAFWSDTDPVVPQESARLDLPGLPVRNVLVPGRGHLTITRDPRLLAGVVQELQAATRHRAAVAA